MSRITTPLDWVKSEQMKEAEGAVLIPDGMTLLELADAVVRGKVKLSPAQMRILIELLPYHLPKLSAVAVGHFDGTDFAGRLDRARERSMKVIEGKTVQVNGQIGVVDEVKVSNPNRIRGREGPR